MSILVPNYMKNSPIDPIRSKQGLKTKRLLSWVGAFYLLLSSGVTWGQFGIEADKEERTLSLEKCIELSLKNNLDLEIQRNNPDIAAYNLNVSYSVYEPSLNFSASHGFNSNPGRFNVQLGREQPSNQSDSDTFSMGVGGFLPTGLSYNLTSSINRSGGNFFNGSSLQDQPTQYFSRAGIDLRQPLLKNSWIDSNRLSIKLSKQNIRSTAEGLRLQVINTLTSVQNAYFDLIAAKENVRVQQKALELSKQLAFENQKRVDFGVMAPLDIQLAQSQVEVNRANLLTAQRNYMLQQNSLKRLITQNYSEWSFVNVRPAENLVAFPEDLDLQESWRLGLENRPDFAQTKLELERRGILLKFRRNQIFPQLDLTGSFGYVGFDQQESDYMASLRDIEQQNDPFYSIGAVLTVPLGNRAERNNYKAAKAEQQQALLQLKRLEVDILVEVENAVRLVETSYARTVATKAARSYQEAALEAEQKRLENGKSTSYTVLQFQRDLTTASSSEIQALSDYNKALVELSRARGTTLEKLNIDFSISSMD
jgi:outer membrane protein TolC